MAVHGYVLLCTTVRWSQHAGMINKSVQGWWGRRRTVLSPYSQVKSVAGPGSRDVLVCQMRVSCRLRSGQVAVSTIKLDELDGECICGSKVLLCQVCVTYRLYSLLPGGNVISVVRHNVINGAAALSWMPYGAVVRRLPFSLKTRIRTCKFHARSAPAVDLCTWVANAVAPGLHHC